jgi:carbon-monoxide dehydrogenase small subunit
MSANGEKRHPQLITLETTVNGTRVAMSVPANRLLVDFLRDDLQLKGTKLSCDVQVCGACTVLLNGRPVSACTTLAYEARGRSVQTIEGLAHENQLHPMQQAFIDHGAFQCGFCTPGMILAATSLVNRVPEPAVADIRETSAAAPATRRLSMRSLPRQRSCVSALATTREPKAEGSPCS